MIDEATLKLLDILCNDNHQKDLLKNKLSEKLTIHRQSAFFSLEKTFQQLQIKPSLWADFHSDAITIGKPSELNQEQREQLYDLLREFSPWRKGPFHLFGIDIDAEWRSNLKWRRLLPFLDDMQGKVILDIGCNNGYYMYKMSAFEPQTVVGLDPTYKFYSMFNLIQALTTPNNLHFLPLGLEDSAHFDRVFDMIFCMGILYHQQDPMAALKLIAQKLKKGGQLVIESMAIPHEQPYALFTNGRYGNARGFYYIPSALCLQNWLSRCGFHHIAIHRNEPLELDEQRRTPWADVDSFYESLKKDNLNETVEGYVRQNRIYITCRI